jgi:endonuclease/exonuclease/phosphatase family metal-dependent hydrolase
MQPFKNAICPDVMAFQEQPGLAARYLADPNYAEFKHGQSVGEFTLVSKYPILSNELIVISTRMTPRHLVATHLIPDNRELFTVAARYVVDVGGQHTVIYNVHLPTPRETLLSYRRGGFLYGLIGIPGTSLGKKREAYQEGWDQRIDLVEQLLERAKSEIEPTLMVGDFNMPSTGYCHHLVSAIFQDAHAAAGSGFGFTFPGTTGNPLALGGPWLRIDYVFADKSHWSINSSLAESDRASQHRATAAELHFLSPASTK